MKALHLALTVSLLAAEMVGAPFNLDVPSGHATIQSAINAAAPGLAGFTMRGQAIVVSPSAMNGFFAASAARDVLFQ